MQKKSHSSCSWDKFPIDAGSDPPAVDWLYRDLIHSQLEMSVVEALEDERGGPNKSYITTTEVVLLSQEIPDQFAMLMHALTESLQFNQRSVPGRSHRSNRAAASTGLSCASEGEQHSSKIIVTTRTTTATGRTFYKSHSNQINTAITV